MLEILTDNRNRTASEIRYLFSRHGGNLGETGCVAWMFDQKGSLVLSLSELTKSVDEIMLEALEAGAEDVKEDEDTIQILTTPADFQTVKEAMEGQGYVFASAEIARIPQNTVEVTDPNDAEKLLKLMDALEDHDDVQNVYSNFDIPDEIMAAFEN